jgi:hypothetical protein
MAIEIINRRHITISMFVTWQIEGRSPRLLRVVFAGFRVHMEMQTTP